MPNLILQSVSVLDSIVLYPFNVVHPAPPTGLSAVYSTNQTNRNQQVVNLTWLPPAASPDILTYNVYRNGAQITGVTAITSPAYQDLTTGGDVEYFTYYVTAVDAEGNESAPSESICNFSLTTETYITQLRQSLKDNPPDPRVQRWSDDDLWLALSMALSRINSIPMNTDFNLDTAKTYGLFNYIIVAARIAALRMQASLEAAKEFSIGIGGASINVNRANVYNSMINSEDQAFMSEIKSIKLNFTMRFVHGEGILTSMLPFRIRTFAPRQYRVR